MRTTVSIAPARADLPRTNLSLLRKALSSLGSSPACLRFTGCRRQLYTAAIQADVWITCRRQRDGSYLVWRTEAPEVLRAPAPSAKPQVVGKVPD